MGSRLASRISWSVAFSGSWSLPSKRRYQIPNGARKAEISEGSSSTRFSSRSVTVAMIFPPASPNIVLEIRPASHAFEQELQDLDVPVRLVEARAPCIKAVSGQ